ncbi:MAG: alpha-ketoglutaric semialdehyde dehydrogenase, partial [Bradyrhizobium sp.]|nr:alpha-ketoglutaric semialdehyde dehydrogenase [Bradyrhizobium sp.]
MSGRGAYLAGAADALLDRAEHIARLMAAEMGKPVREARSEVVRSAQILRYATAQASMSVGEIFEQSASGHRVCTRRRPVGTVGLITPWNFPCAIPVWKIAPALIYGNTVVIKLAYEAPATGLQVAACFQSAGLPRGVLNVLTGHGSTVGAALVSDPRVDAVSFTGSVATGTSVRDAATSHGARVQLELGGQNAMVVMADADLDRASDAACAGAFSSAGQKCTATRRVYVQDGVYDEFKRRFLDRTAGCTVGDPLDEKVDVGPLVSGPQLADVLAAIDVAKQEGATLLSGGVRLSDEAHLLAPTVFEGATDDSILTCDEVFGPVTSLYRFSSLDDAMRRANAGRFGLAASIFTSDLATATRFQAEAQAGLIHVNSATTGADVHVPFGGIRDSGFGPHEQGQAARDFYTDLVTVYVDP